MKVLSLKRAIGIFAVIFLLNAQIFALELDTSVDDEIRKNYNPSALENTLPALPKVPAANTQATPKQPASNQVPPKDLPQTNQTSKPQVGMKKLPQNQNFDKSTAIKIKKGTKFKVRSNSVISDYLKEGARVNFTTTQSVTQRYITVPAGANFRAYVAESHQPQYTGNGGLVVLMADSIQFSGKSYPVKAKITKANTKKIFFNNIKGKRQYWHGVSNQIDKGEKFYKKTRKTSYKLADNPVGILISPVPVVVGMAGYAVNLVGAPLLAIWSKGSRISIPAGSQFEIKLLEDVYLTY